MKEKYLKKKKKGPCHSFSFLFCLNDACFELTALHEPVLLFHKKKGFNNKT